MSAWFALTQGHYEVVVRAASAGLTATRTHGVTVQLLAQDAKARARLGDRDGVRTALESGRALLEALPPPDHREHHFVVDPTKQDFYEMDCHRIVGDDAAAAERASEVLRLHANQDGSDRAPLRMAEAWLTLATVAARQGDLEAAVHGGFGALEGTRQSLPSLLLSAGELAAEIRTRYPREDAGRDYAERLRELGTRG